MNLWQYLKLESQLLEKGHDEVLHRVEALAEHEQRSPDEVIVALLDQALDTQRTTDELHRLWNGLSPREKQVAALVCEGLTSRQVAAKLVVSPETIKTHMRHILRKFGLHSRRELRESLVGWDLNAWCDTANLL